VTQAGRSAVYVAQAEHPLYAGLRLVVWKLDDGSWSHDALRPDQDVGEAAVTVPYQRVLRLRRALGL
jgi:hypothetical protein